MSMARRLNRIHVGKRRRRQRIEDIVQHRQPALTAAACVSVVTLRIRRDKAAACARRIRDEGPRPHTGGRSRRRSRRRSIGLLRLVTQCIDVSQFVRSIIMERWDEAEVNQLVRRRNPNTATSVFLDQSDYGDFSKRQIVGPHGPFVIEPK